MASFGMIPVTIIYSDDGVEHPIGIRRSSTVEFSQDIIGAPYFRDDVMKLAEAVAAVSDFAIAVSCPSVQLNEVVKALSTDPYVRFSMELGRFTYRNHGKYNQISKSFTILAPQKLDAPILRKTMKKGIGRFAGYERSETVQAHLRNLEYINTILLKLSNIQPYDNYGLVHYRLGFDSIGAKWKKTGRR